MKIAYLILAHEQPKMFSKLVHALDSEGVSIFAHIDAKSDERPFRQAIISDEVKFVSDRIYVNWGGYSQTQAMLMLLELAFSSGPHDYYIFLSGRDYPIKSNQKIAMFLKNSNGKSYINFYPLVEGTHLFSNIQGYCYHDLYAKLPSHFLRKSAMRIAQSISHLMPARQFLNGMMPYRGSSSWCLSQNVVSYILDFVANPNNKNYLRFFRSISCSDEIFFQTIVLNSPLANTCQNYEEDICNKKPGEAKNENKVYLHYIDWNPAREDPALLDLSDLPALSETDKFFARKFELIKSKELLDKIDFDRED
jgi:hypothetical protein